MPYADDYLLDDDEDKLTEAPQLAGSTQVVGGGASTQAPVTAAGAPTKSDRYQNLNDYITANQGSNFGQQFVGKVQGETDKANSVQADSFNKFKTAADQGTVNYNEGLVNDAMSDPASFVQDPNKLSQFQSQRDAQYTGPDSYSAAPESYQAAYSATKRAQDAARASTTEGGRFALLGDYFGKPQYTQGQKSLDNLLVQNDPTTQAGIAQAKENANAAKIGFENQNKEAAQYAGQKSIDTEAARNKTRSAIGIDGAGNRVASGGIVNDFLNSLNTNLEARRGDIQEEEDVWSPFRNSGKFQDVPAELLQKAGVSDADSPQYEGRIASGRYLGVRPADYFASTRRQDLNAGNVATEADAAKLSALSKLSNLDLPVTGIEDAGKYDDGDLVGFDSARFKSDLGSKQAAYKAEVENPKYWAQAQGGNASLASAIKKGQVKQDVYSIRDWAKNMQKTSSDSAFPAIENQMQGYINAINGKFNL